jgi:hypothetical protein
MSRPAARITEDEVRRMVKAVAACGLPIARVTFDGAIINVVIGSGDIGENRTEPGGQEQNKPALIREPQT